MSWLDIFRVEAEKRNAEAAAIASAAIEAERARLAEEAEEREAQRTARRKIRVANWRDANRERINAYQREYRKTHPQKSRDASGRLYKQQWNAMHPGKNAEYKRRHRAKMRELRKAAGNFINNKGAES